MGIITGGKVIEPGGVIAPGTRQSIYYTEAVPTDANIGTTAANGMLAQNVATGFLYERQAGLWVRIDTL